MYFVCRLGYRDEREKGWHLVHTPLSTPLPLLPTSSMTHLASYHSLVDVPYSYELLDTPPCMHTGMHRLAHTCAHIPSRSQTRACVSKQAGTCRGGAKWLGAGVEASQLASWLGEGTCK